MAFDERRFIHNSVRERANKSPAMMMTGDKDARN
jgi:hypothetical protein